MLRAILILIVSVSVSACSSQGRTQAAEQVTEVVLGIAFDAYVHDDSLDYDGSEILPSRNQRLAYQLDANCETPLTESEFCGLDLGDQPFVLYGDDHQPWQIEEQTFVPLSTDYQDFLQRQSEIIEHAKNRGPAVLREPDDLTESPPLERGEF